jgi:hypothetical protein
MFSIMDRCSQTQKLFKNLLSCIAKVLLSRIAKIAQCSAILDILLSRLAFADPGVTNSIIDYVMYGHWDIRK